MRIWLPIALMALGAALTYGGFKVNAVGYEQGNRIGYETGYTNGNSAGYASGKQEGYNLGKDDGYTSGKNDGYTLGYATGRQEGYDNGYSSGETTGRKAGYEEGMQAGLGHGYTLRDPTYQEVITFLKEDRTDKNAYSSPSYVCSHFAMDVCNNAEAKGIRCAFVELRYTENGHAIIAFNTVDKNIIPNVQTIN